MSSRPGASERFDPTRHSTANFDSTNDSLDRWLTRSAGHTDRRDGARTFVCADDRGQVLAYYALLAGELNHSDATDEVRKGMSRRYPIPVAILARLAVDRRWQGQGIGATMLADALTRVAIAADQVAVRAVVVHAIDDPARTFYAHYGFRALTDTPLTLMVTLAELRAAGYA